MNCLYVLNIKNTTSIRSILYLLVVQFKYNVFYGCKKGFSLLARQMWFNSVCHFIRRTQRLWLCCCNYAHQTLVLLRLLFLHRPFHFIFIGLYSLVLSIPRYIFSGSICYHLFIKLHFHIERVDFETHNGEKNSIVLFFVRFFLI